MYSGDIIDYGTLQIFISGLTSGRIEVLTSFSDGGFYNLKETISADGVTYN